MTLKTPIFRSRKLLDLAKDAPVCFACMDPNDGTVVACHSNNSFDGKGLGLKAKDYRIFYGCNDCHVTYDKSDLPRAQKQEIFERAHRATIGWLFESGHLKVITNNAEIQAIMGEMG